MCPPRILAAIALGAVVLGVAVGAGEGRATAPLPVVEPPGHAGLPWVLSPGATCVLEPSPLLTSTAYAWTTPDAFSTVYWRVPAPCAACGPGQTLDLETVSFRLRWFGPCTAQAEISLVGSTGPPGCLVPDPGQLLCGPVSHPIEGTAAAGVVHTLNAPAGCCVPPGAFVEIRFIGLNGCYPSGPSPGLTRAAAGCAPCDQYVTTTLSLPFLTDWCSFGPATGALWVQIGADCCAPVGIGPGGATGGGTGIAILETFARRVRIELTLSGSGVRPVEVDVYDIAGRRVRGLLRADLEGGRHTTGWDGLDDGGARLPAGVYKLRLRDGSARAVATAVLLD